MQRLFFKLPTALQLERGYAILFHDGSTSKFTSLNKAVNYMELEFSPSSSRILAPIGSNKSPSEPPSMFHTGKPFFAVEAPSRQNSFEWVEKVDYRYLYMKTWAFQEVLQAYVTPPRSSQHSRFLQPSVHGTRTRWPL